MQYWRCRCGNTELRESGMPPRTCQVCADCGSTLAQTPQTHQEPTRHTLQVRYSETTGLPKYFICTQCMTRVPLDKVPPLP